MDYQAQIDALKAQIASISVSKDISRDSETALVERLSGNFQAFPVGSVFTSTTDTNPSTMLGYGTWEAFGSGQVLVGYASGDSDFGTLGATGGEKIHTLTKSEMPTHDHQTGTGHTIGSLVWYDGDGVNMGGAGSATQSQRGLPPDGGGQAHNNLQPYLVVFFWKRTA